MNGRSYDSAAWHDGSVPIGLAQLEVEPERAQFELLGPNPNRFRTEVIHLNIYIH